MPEDLAGYRSPGSEEESGDSGGATAFVEKDSGSLMPSDLAGAPKPTINVDDRRIKNSAKLHGQLVYIHDAESNWFRQLDSIDSSTG